MPSSAVRYAIILTPSAAVHYRFSIGIEANAKQLYHFPMKFVGKKGIPSDKNKCSSLKFSRSDGLSTPQTTPVSFVELRLHSGC